MYVLSNKMRNYGAACIVYPHILEMIWNILQTDYYVLPSSVHEVIITPCHKSITCEELDEMIQDINATQIDAEEVLSGHAYLYEHRHRQAVHRHRPFGRKGDGMMKCRYYLKNSSMPRLLRHSFCHAFVGRNGLAEAQNADCSAETTEKALLYEKIVLG